MAESPSPLALVRFEDAHSDTVLVVLGTRFLLPDAIYKAAVEWNCHIKGTPLIEDIGVAQVGPYVDQILESYGTDKVFLALGLEGYNNSAPETSIVRSPSREAFRVCMKAPLAYTVKPYTEDPSRTSAPPINGPWAMKTLPVSDHSWYWFNHYVLALAVVATCAMLFL